MKKVFLFLGLGFISLTACNKEYTCSCVVSGTVKSKDAKLYNTKRQSKENCDALTGDTITIEGISGIADCQIIGSGI
jgi:hypothetical protein